MTVAFLEASAIGKRFGSTAALRGASLDVAEGAFACIVGPSGCGKTTLLRVIAGLDAADAGAVRLDGRDLARVPVHARPIAMVFQEGALFPHLDVAENVAFALRVAGVPRGARDARVRDLLALVGLDAFGPRRPDGLSGGERQRVALARALARDPRLLLMDEPLASLDRERRESMRREIRRLHDATGLTTLMVTHDQEEALALADALHVMAAGRVVESGPPREIYLRPRTAFAARFLASGNVIAPDAARRLGAPRSDATLLVPRHAVRLAPPESTGVEARVEEVRFLGRVDRVRLGTAEGPIEADSPVEDAVAPGARVRVEIAWDAARALR